jgi:predicted acetyltransferase
MTVTIDPINSEDKPVLRNLLELYQYDFTQFEPNDIGNHGLYGYPYLDNYWTEDGRYPFFIRIDGKLAGFVLMRSSREGNEIAEFFILKKYRRQGIGREVAFRIFDSFPGHWNVSQDACNAPGQKFWRTVIADYTSGQYTEKTTQIENGMLIPSQEFTSRNTGT